MYVSTSQKSLQFLNLPPEFAYLDFRVWKKINFIFNYLPPDPVKLGWEGSGNQ